MSEEKIYLFSYGTIQEELFYKNIFHEGVKKMPAILNGYAKCVDETNYFLLKKDIGSQVEGTVFEITKDELFAVDRWEMFPQYQRMQANVLNLENNEILENVYVYTKLEFGKYYLATEDMGFSVNPNATEENLKSFIELEKRTAQFGISDNILVYELSDEEYDQIKDITHPYFALILDDKENKLFSAEPYTLIGIENDNKKYGMMVSFGQKTGLNSIFYYKAFNGLFPDSKINITFKNLYLELKHDFLTNKKPIYFSSAVVDATKNQDQVGWYQNVAFQVVFKNFNIDPFKRFDQQLQAFFETKNK
ncbi:gamma-glutamylcyclotransferase family protein [Metamycoplasma spumans]|uniref:gamma-glutamylcyclotransferase family protein n=1 Tax=Metamycoplasma spumans TaxID=92406 RepID=UPI0034DCEB3A